MYRTVPYLLYCTVLYCTVLYCTVLYCTVLYYTVLYCTVLYCTVLYYTVLYCTVLYCTILYCTVLYCTVLYCTVLYCTVPYQATERTSYPKWTARYSIQLKPYEISGLCRHVVEAFALLRCYAAVCRRFGTDGLPKRLWPTINLRCLKSQDSEDLNNNPNSNCTQYYNIFLFLTYFAIHYYYHNHHHLLNAGYLYLYSWANYVPREHRVAAVLLLYR